MHTLGTIRGTHVRLSSLRSQRVVGRGAPRGMTKLRYEVVAIFGPTASGKSEVAQALADRIGTEVVSADALQVYRGLPILTNQPARSDASRRHPRRVRDDVRGRVCNARPRRDRRARGDQGVRRRRRRDGSVPPCGARRPRHSAGSSVRDSHPSRTPLRRGSGRGVRRGFASSTRRRARQSIATTAGASSARSSSPRAAPRSSPPRTGSGRRTCAGQRSSSGSTSRRRSSNAGSPPALRRWWNMESRTKSVRSCGPRSRRRQGRRWVCTSSRLSRSGRPRSASP